MGQPDKGTNLRKEIIMNDKRHYLRYTCITLLLICLVQVYTANAAASPSLSTSADAASVAEGDTVNVSVKLSGNPTVSTLGVALGYDSSVLSYDSISWGSGFSGSDMKMVSDTGSEVNLSVVCEDSYSADGTVATVKFQAVSDSSSIPVTLALRDMADADLEEVTDCKVSGKVRVPEVTSDTSNKNDSSGKSDSAKKDKNKNTNNSSGPKIEDTSTANAGNTTSTSNTAGASNTTSTSNTASTSNTTGVSSTSTVTVSAQQAAGSISQSTSVQKAQAAPASGTGSAKPDQSYKTGAGIGNDIFLVIAAACGILALVLLAFRCGEEEK